jgi:hypothetical protein
MRDYSKLERGDFNQCKMPKKIFKINHIHIDGDHERLAMTNCDI